MKTITKYTAIPDGFVQVKSGLIQSGDVIHYCETECIEDCVCLVGKTIASVRPSKVYRAAKANAESKHTPISFPKVYGITTHSKHGSAGLFTVDGSYNPLDATAQSLSPELVLARAHFAADAINSHPELLRQRDELIAELRFVVSQADGDLSDEQFRNYIRFQMRNHLEALASADKGDK